jgi:hypothetical protein
MLVELIWCGMVYRFQTFKIETGLTFYFIF